MKNHFTFMETIRIAYLASRDADDSFINCLIACLELKKYCNAFLKAGGTLPELKKILLGAEEDCN